MRILYLTRIYSLWDYCVFISRYLVWVDLDCIDIVSIINVNNITRNISNVSCVIALGIRSMENQRATNQLVKREIIDLKLPPIRSREGDEPLHLFTLNDPLLLQIPHTIQRVVKNMVS